MKRHAMSSFLHRTFLGPPLFDQSSRHGCFKPFAFQIARQLSIDDDSLVRSSTIVRIIAMLLLLDISRSLPLFPARCIALKVSVVDNFDDANLPLSKSQDDESVGDNIVHMLFLL